MKIQDLSTNDSSFIDVDLNEAANVRGGYDWSPNDFNYNLEEQFGTSSLSTIYARQYPNRYAQTRPTYRSFDDTDRGMRNANAMVNILRDNGVYI